MWSLIQFLFLNCLGVLVSRMRLMEENEVGREGESRALYADCLPLCKNKKRGLVKDYPVKMVLVGARNVVHRGGAEPPEQWISGTFPNVLIFWE